MNRREAIATLSGLGLSTTTQLPQIAHAQEIPIEEPLPFPEEIVVAPPQPEQTSLIPFTELEKLPDNPLEAARYLVSTRPPILYPETQFGTPLMNHITSEVRVRLEHLAQRFQYNLNDLLRVGFCESRLYPNSINFSAWGYDKPSGTYQFKLQTFVGYLGIAADYRKDLDVEALLFMHAYRISPGEWECR